MPGRQCCSFQSVAVGSKGFQRVAKILTGSIVCGIIHQLLFLAYLHQIEFATYVGRTTNQQIGLDGRQQFISGTVLQGDVHCYIIRKGFVLERLDRLVMFDDFGLFHIFCLDVFFQLVVFAAGQVESFHGESIDRFTIVVDTAILLNIHARQLFQYIFQGVVSFVGKAGKIERNGISPCDTGPFHLHFFQHECRGSHTNYGFYFR